MNRSIARLSVAAVAILSLPCLTQKVSAQAALPVNYGELVHTLQSGNDLPGRNVVVTLVDTRFSSAPFPAPGVNFLAPLYWNAIGGAFAWTSNNLGEVFGVALDNSYPNIYVTAASEHIYPGATGAGPAGRGGVYRLNGSNGDIGQLVTLPNHPTTGPGLGNITYSPRTNSLYVSNFEDGLIYRIPLGASAAVPAFPVLPTSLTTYNHGTSGRQAAGLAAIPDAGTLGTITAFGRRVWGLAVNPADNRLYYSVWWEDEGQVGPPPASGSHQNAIESNEVWSVPLNGAGDPIAAFARGEFALPVYSGVYSNPVAGLNFTPNGTMLVAERSGYYIQNSGQFAHHSRLYEYIGSTGAWTRIATTPPKYRVGLGDTSCTGAGDMDCAGNVWTVGDGVIHQSGNPVELYGMMRIPANGNAASLPFNFSTSILIDSDQNTASIDKTRLGTLVCRKECAPCRTTPPPVFVRSRAADQRCGILEQSTIHYSIDTIGQASNPGGMVTVGSQLTPSGLTGLHIVVWDAAGNVLRQALFNTNTANQQIVATSVDVDASCNILVAGRMQLGGVPSTFAARFDPLLKPVWVTEIPGNMNAGQNVQADWLSDGTVIVCGTDGAASNPTMGKVTKLTSGGVRMWSTRLTSLIAANRRLMIEDVEQAPGANGNIWACGYMDWPAATGGYTRLPCSWSSTSRPARSAPRASRSTPIPRARRGSMACSKASSSTLPPGRTSTTSS